NSGVEPRFYQLRRSPTGPVGERVSESWLVEAARCRTAVERSLADAAVEIYFNLGPEGRHVYQGGARSALAPRAAWVVGPHERPLLIEKEIANCDVVGVRLRPGTSEQVLGVPASELRESLVDLDLLWGRTVDDVRDRLRAAPDPVARL